MQKTQVEILPTAVVFDDKSKFRSRGLLRFGKPIRLDAYIDEFLSAPSPSDEPARGSAPRVKEDGTVPATPESMTRTNTSTGQASVESYASPAHRAVARLTADLQRAAPDHAAPRAGDAFWLSLWEQRAVAPLLQARLLLAARAAAVARSRPGLT